jgi:mono/diheme cytochrome c family protein
MKWPWILIVTALLIAAGILFLYSGYYNVAASQAHWRTTLRLVNEVRELSIAFHSRNIKPPSLEVPGLLERGIRYYHESCRVCHGAPSFPPDEFARGLYPKPPDMAAEHVQEMGKTRIFWVLKHGIKMTGMPAFGSKYSDDVLWAIVKFLMSLPDMKSDQYRKVLETGDSR